MTFLGFFLLRVSFFFLLSCVGDPSEESARKLKSWLQMDDVNEGGLVHDDESGGGVNSDAPPIMNDEGAIMTDGRTTQTVASIVAAKLKQEGIYFENFDVSVPKNLSVVVALTFFFLCSC